MSASSEGSAVDQSTPDRPTLAAFAGFIILAGSVAIAVRFTFGQLSPFWGGFVRFGTAALIFWLLMLVRRVRLPRGRALLGAVIFGALSVGLAMSLAYYGLTKTEASLYSTTVAIVPLLTLIFAAAHGLERFNRRGAAGGLLAVVGIAVAVSGSLLSDVEFSLPHYLAIVAGAACFAESGIVVKLFPPCHPYATNAVAMSVGSLILLTISLISGETWAMPSTVSVWLALAYIIVGGTVATFLLYLFVLQRWTATGTSYGFVLIPVVTVIFATLFTDETISLIFLLGAVIVLVGVYFGALSSSKKPAVPAEEEDIQARPGVPTCV